MFKLTTFTLLAGLAAGATQAGTLTFDEAAYGVGSAVTSFDVDGVTGSISATGGVETAIIFDSTTLSGGDNDLVAPFYLTRGDRRKDVNGLEDAGNILIIAENSDFDDPDDAGRGGTITFIFDTLVDFTGFRVFDDVTDFVVTGSDGQTSGPINLGFDNAYADIVTSITNTSFLTFDFGTSSGAIDDLQFTAVAPVPLPAGLPLLLLGLGGLAAASRRKS